MSENNKDLGKEKKYTKTENESKIKFVKSFEDNSLGVCMYL